MRSLGGIPHYSEPAGGDLAPSYGIKNCLGEKKVYRQYPLEAFIC